MPTITIELNKETNRLVELYQATKGLKTKENAINEILKKAETLIMKEVMK